MDDEDPACVGVMQPGQPSAVLLGLVPAFRPSHIRHIGLRVLRYSHPDLGLIWDASGFLRGRRACIGMKREYVTDQATYTLAGPPMKRGDNVQLKGGRAILQEDAGDRKHGLFRGQHVEVI